jgi:hypothetical protein
MPFALVLPQSLHSLFKLLSLFLWRPVRVHDIYVMLRTRAALLVWLMIRWEPKPFRCRIKISSFRQKIAEQKGPSWYLTDEYKLYQS